MQGNGRGTPDPRAACIDAETLAAWADGGLPRAEAAVVETHLADCDRCTAMLATFARTIPDVPVAEPLWKRWHLRWLVPVATAATVAALWVLVPRPESPQMTASRAIARNDSQAGIESQASGAAGAAQLATPSETKEQEARFRVSQSKPADTLAKREESPSATLDDARGSRDEKLPQPLPLNETVTIAPSAPVPAPAREADRAEAKSTDTQTERFSPVAPSANATPPAAQTPAAPTSSRAGETAAAKPPTAAAGQGTFRSAAEAPAALSAREQSAIVEIASPDPMTRWRVVGTGRVERSTNGGARWEPATLPESATLIAGSSPSPSVCWLVGRAGSIYVTTDGLRFVRVPFSDRTDFVSIRATDGRRATVVTLDGRTMRTDDQGANWIRVNP